MKKTFVLVLLTFNTIVFSQTYTFDQINTFELRGTKDIVISSSVKAINSQSFDYYMNFPSKHTAEFYDRSTNFRHDYRVKYLNDGKVLFEYVKTCNEAVENSSTQRDFKVEKNGNEIVLAKYETAKSSQPYFEIKFNLEESDNSEMSILHEIDPEFMAEMKPYLNQNYSVKQLNYFVKRKKGKELHLAETTRVDFQIELPQDLKFDCEKN